jgi:diguanylate cyclase (GGDEF)-like protein
MPRAATFGDTVDHTSSSLRRAPQIHSERLRTTLLAQVQRQLPRFLIMTALSVLLAVWILWEWPSSSNKTIALWSGSFISFLLIHGILVWELSRNTQLRTRWLSTILIITAVISGSLWAFVLIALNPHAVSISLPNADISSRQILFAALLGAQGITALAAYAGHLRAFVGFTLAAFLPALVHLMLHPMGASIMVPSIAAVWWIFLMLSVLYLNRMISDAIMLRLSNEDLIAFLRDTQERTLDTNRILVHEVSTRARAETQLQSLNEELEQRVAHRTEALMESQEGLTLAIEASGMALWDWHILDQEITHTNLEPMLGCEDIGDHKLLDVFSGLIHPDDIRLVKRNIMQHFRRRTARFEARYRIKHARGHWVWVEDRGRVVNWTAQGKPERMLGTRRDITREREAEDTQRKLDYLANYDRLTQLTNRRQFRNRLHAAINTARDTQTRVGLVFINLDRFRQINESLGFEVGDSILRESGRRLTELGSKLDTLARIGGDEFALIFPDIHSNDDLERLSEEVIGSLRAPFSIGEHELLLGASVGICEFPEHGRELATLINHADLAMQQAKRLGGNQWRRYSPDMRSATIEQLHLENSLRKAIFRDEFIVHYQPKLSLSSQRIVGVEALVRWQHPTLGLLHPGKFIALAEATGLILLITERVLSQATTQLRAWTDAGLGELHVAVNIPAQQLHKGNLMQLIEQALCDSGLNPSQLEIELTESSLMDDPDLAISLFKQIRRMGVSIALDDFGTGYSSLSHLRRFPIDILKIDQAFIRHVGRQSEDGAIVRAIITMAHELGMKVVAEGVETKEHYHFLEQERCDIVQGYLISHPVTAEAMEQLLREQALAEREQLSFLSGI